MAEDSDSKDQAAGVARFPQSRVRPPGVSTDGFKVLGMGPMARLLGSPVEQTTGHWCSHCRGIWYGYLLECTCPSCGLRHGGRRSPGGVVP